MQPQPPAYRGGYAHPAESLFRLGRHAEALRWYRTFPSLGSPPEAAMMSFIYYRLGQIYEVLGEPDRATGYYTRFATRWAEADSALRHLVAEARQRTSLLTSRE